MSNRGSITLVSCKASSTCWRSNAIDVSDMAASALLD